MQRNRQNQFSEWGRTGAVSGAPEKDEPEAKQGEAAQQGRLARCTVKGRPMSRRARCRGPAQGTASSKQAARTPSPPASSVIEPVARLGLLAGGPVRGGPDYESGPGGWIGAGARRLWRHWGSGQSPFPPPPFLSSPFPPPFFSPPFLHPPPPLPRAPPPFFPPFFFFSSPLPFFFFFCFSSPFFPFFFPPLPRPPLPFLCPPSPLFPPPPSLSPLSSPSLLLPFVPFLFSFFLFPSSPPFPFLFLPFFFYFPHHLEPPPNVFFQRGFLGGNALQRSGRFPGWWAWTADCRGKGLGPGSAMSYTGVLFWRGAIDQWRGWPQQVRTGLFVLLVRACVPTAHFKRTMCLG